MTLLNKKNIYAALDEAVPDPAVGISLAHVTGDESFSIYVTKLPSQCQLTAHYHEKGDELYHVVEGAGVIWLAADGGEKTPHELTEGDTFMVPEGTVHQLVNSGTQPMVMLFGCAQTHITTDRQLVDRLNPE